MSEETNLEGEIVYKCLQCGWLYRNRLIADKCEAWCKNNRICNLEFAKHAIKINEVKTIK